MEKGLYCSLGHLMCRLEHGKKLVLTCSDDGHGELERDIDLEQLVALAIQAGFFSLDRVKAHIEKPTDQPVFFIRPPKHQRKLMFELINDRKANDDYIQYAGICADGRIWLVSRKQHEYPKLSLRLEDDSNVYSDFLQVGNVISVEKNFAYLYKKSTTTCVHVSIHEGINGWKTIPLTGLKELQTHTADWWHCADENNDPLADALDGDLRAAIRAEQERQRLDQWCTPYKKHGDVAVWHNDSSEAECFVKTYDQQSVRLVVRGFPGPIYERIHAVRLITDVNGVKRIVYVANNGPLVYKVMVKLPSQPSSSA